MPILRVALDVALPGLLDYLAPDGTPADVGRRVRVPFGRGTGEKLGVVFALAEKSEIPAHRLRGALEILRDMPALPPDWLEMLAFCSSYYQHPLGEVVAFALPPVLRRAGPLPEPDVDTLWRATDAGLAARGELRKNAVALKVLDLLAREGPQRESHLRGLSAAVGRGLPEWRELDWIAEVRVPPDRRAVAGPELTSEQAEVLATLTAALGGYAPFLLHGVTGSGKTEVYLRLIETVLARGGQALMLVPEIALTPQLEGRVKSRFPGAHVVSLHSGLSDGARARGFLAALAGEADIVLGTRLSVFTPLPRLGLIVVDEEHDPSFKQQDGIRYSARDLAVWRARQRQVPVLLGSATPGLESWHAAASGRYRRLSLTRRAVALSLPRVRILDTRRIKLEEGLSPELLAGIVARLERGEQSLIFLNRRGYAPVLACPACGWISHCRACSANLVLHLADGRMRCHHCGAEGSVPRACPTCGNQDIHPFGRGTQRLESAMAERFPNARVLRVDRDSASTPTKWNALLEAIHGGRADILVGTQMLAKGHDFPKLTLVGVLNADASLFAADFRAPERLFAQLLQVGGRSGRADLPGEVLVQTEYPEHPLYQALATHDYDHFADAQLAERRQAGFPPFSHQALLRAEAPELAQSLAFLAQAKEAAAQLPERQEGVSLFDPVPMRLARRAHLERAQLLLESSSRPRLQAFLCAWLPRLRSLSAPRKLRWLLDVDPLEL
ncbi:MAG: primosomal protein N' [Rhodocyclaceae bacterium]|nr:primosomal protein N' [Rhodocyclaceae bacterium]